MTNFTTEDEIVDGIAKQVLKPLPSGGISEEEVYETWYVYECPNCTRRMKESYRCELISNQ